jgi:hypothetical protein
MREGGRQASKQTGIRPYANHEQVTRVLFVREPHLQRRGAQRQTATLDYAVHPQHIPSFSTMCALSPFYIPLIGYPTIKTIEKVPSRLLVAPSSIG